MLEVLAIVAALAQVPAPPAADDVLEGEWTVEVVDNIRIMPDAAVTITFRGTRVTGLASCNTFQGGFTARDGGGGKWGGRRRSASGHREQQPDRRDPLHGKQRYR